MAYQMASWLTGALLFMSLLSAAISYDDSVDTFSPAIVYAHHGAVATDDERCSKIGRDMLEVGGHAVDAAVAIAFCQGVVRPAMSGIGGGGFMIIKQANEEPVALDMREVAPGSSSEDMYHGDPSKKFQGIHSIAVPGQVKGLYEAWRKYGRIGWRWLVLPAEKQARYGFTISKNIYEMMEIVKDNIMKDRGLRSVFAPKGKLLKAGEICRNVKLADTLSQIGTYGADTYYKGRVGENLIKDIQEAAGNLTMDDLNRYDIELKEPVSLDVKELGLKLYGVPPPASGAASIFLILNILAQYGFPMWMPYGLQAHRRVEALKHAFAVRMNIGDPNFVNVTDVLNDMFSPKFAAELRKTIYDNMTFDPTHYGGKWNLWDESKEDGTTHYCVVDRDRNAVSVTTTINFFFGSGFLSPRTGIILNNHMDDFSIPVNCTSSDCVPPAPANFIRPYKRPLSAAAPIVIMQGKQLRGVIGSSGGPRIIGATALVFLNYFVSGMDAYKSVKEPRYFSQLVPAEVQYENTTNAYGDNFLVSKIIRDGLARRGHTITNMRGESGVCNFIVQEFMPWTPNGLLVAVSDPRYGGKPAGY